MRLVSCGKCRTQYDVTNVTTRQLSCSCGSTVENIDHSPVDAAIRRCGSCGASLPTDQNQCEYCGSTVVRDRHRLSLICPDCYARNPEDSGFCTNCGVEFLPQPVIGEGETLSCPCCDVEMSVRPIGGIHVQECSLCSGLWVPGDDFDSLVDRAIASLKTRASDGLGIPGKGAVRRSDKVWKVEYRRCPVCSGVMVRKNFGARSGVIVDWCGNDGTWLDADELEEIAGFILSGGLDREASRLTGGNVRPESIKQYEAMVTSDRLMERERVDEPRRPGGWIAKRDRTGSTLGDLLKALIDW